MKAYRQITLGLMLGATASLAHAYVGDADKIGNGGQSVDVSGRPSLRDLVDRSVCVWHRGTAFLGQLRNLSQAFKAMDRIHPIYADLLRAEAAGVTVCLTEGSLIQVQTEDRDGLTIWEGFNGQQLAIRAGNLIYIDMKIFGQMDATNQAYLMIHELMHGFLAHDTERRNTKLRSFVNFLHEYEARPMDRDFFLTQIQMNSVNWPASEGELDQTDAISRDVSVVLDPRLPAEVRFETQTRIAYTSFFKRAYGKQYYAALDFANAYQSTAVAKLNALESADDAEGMARELGALPSTFRKQREGVAYCKTLAANNRPSLFAQNCASMPTALQDEFFEQAEQSQSADVLRVIAKNPVTKIPVGTLFKWLRQNETNWGAYVGRYPLKGADMFEALLSAPNAKDMLSVKDIGETPMQFVKYNLKRSRNYLKESNADEVEGSRRWVNYEEQMMAVLQKHGAR